LAFSLCPGNLLAAAKHDGCAQRHRRDPLLPATSHGSSTEVAAARAPSEPSQNPHAPVHKEQRYENEEQNRPDNEMPPPASPSRHEHRCSQHLRNRCLAVVILRLI